eukprot:1006228-Prymnesium_polylepis.1
MPRCAHGGHPRQGKERPPPVRVRAHANEGQSDRWPAHPHARGMTRKSEGAASCLPRSEDPRASLYLHGLRRHWLC